MRRTKALLFTAFAASSLASLFSASAMAAPGFLAESSPSTLTGTNLNHHVLHTRSASLGCKNVSLEGTIFSPESTVARAHTITLAPQFKECKFGNFSPATIYTNECLFTFHVAEGGEAGTVDIGGSGCSEIMMVAPACTLRIPPQSLDGISYRNEGTGSQATVDIGAVMSGIEYEQQGFDCPKGTYGNGIYDGEWRVSTGSGVGFSVHAELPVGIYVEPAPQLGAEEFPITLAGDQQAENPLVLGTFVGSMTCDEASFEGPQSSASTEVALEASFGGCFLSGTGVNVTVNSNGCEYVFGVASASSGDLVLQCPEGKSTTVSGPGCTLTIPPQQLGGVSYENHGSGYNRTISADVNGSELSYSHKGFLCGTATRNDGTFGGAVTLRGIG